MTDRPFNEVTSLVIVANEFPNHMMQDALKAAHEGQYFREIYMRWRDLFELVPEAKNVPWHRKIDFDDEEMFYRTMRLLVEADTTPPDVYMDLVVSVDGLTIRWKEFLEMVPEAADVDWLKIAEKFPNEDPTLPDDAE